MRGFLPKNVDLLHDSRLDLETVPLVARRVGVIGEEAREDEVDEEGAEARRRREVGRVVHLEQHRLRLEVNYSPDYGTVSSFYPSFVNEAFELLFEPELARQGEAQAHQHLERLELG